MRGMNLAPAKARGQNFVRDARLVRAAVEAARLDAKTALVEVGPGTGSLTAALAETHLPMLCIELDRSLAAFLGTEYARENLEIVCGDVLARKRSFHPRLIEFMREQTQRGRKVVFVANLPYAILTPFFWNLLEVAPVWDRGVFLVQREFHQRLSSPPGRKTYGPLTAVAALYWEISALRRVSPGTFWPAPGVESVLMSVDQIRPGEVPDRGFSEFLKILFAQRRKMLVGALRRIAPDVEAGLLLEELGFDPRARAEEIGPERLLELYRKFTAP